jgi:hypothetical protein
MVIEAQRCSGQSVDSAPYLLPLWLSLAPLSIESRNPFVQALIKFFVELCLLRRPPQDLPASEMLLGLVLVADLVVGVLVGITAGLSWLTSLLQGVAELLLLMVALYAALTQLKLRARFLQAATALLGSGAVLGLVAIPPLSLNPTGSQENDLAALGAFLLLGLVIWGILVTGHILRHTFSITLGQGSAIAVAFQIVAVTLVTSLFSGL